MMKKILILLFAIAPMMGYAEHDNEWIRKVLGSLEEKMDYLKGYFHAPSEEFVYVQEFGLQETITDDAYEDPTHRIIRDSVSHKLPASHMSTLFSYFVFALKADSTAIPEQCPENSFQISTAIRDAYRTLKDEDYAKTAVKPALLLRHFGKMEPSGFEKMKQVLLRGGEYNMSASNNLETAHDVKLTVLSDPICSFDVEPAGSDGFKMNRTACLRIMIGSGYPYADRISKYQGGEMIFSITDANNDVVHADTFKLDASEDSIKMEFFKGFAEQETILTSPKLTYRLSGPLLEEDLVKVVEVAPDYAFLEQAIKDAEALADSISKTPELTKLAEEAKALKDAVDAAKPCLELSAYEQMKIDGATQTLSNLIGTTKEKIDQTLSVRGVTTDVQKNGTVKKVVDGEIRIITNERTFNLKGIEVK